MRSLSRTIIAACIVIVVAISLLSVIVSNPPEIPPETQSISWPYEEGTELTFKLTIDGYSLYSEIPYSYLNNTLLLTNITTLHDINESSYEFDFNDLLSEIKTETYQDNGSIAPAELNQLISWSLVPTGVYQLINDMFVDEPEYLHDCNTYLSSQSGDLLTYGHRQFNVDAGHGWNCVINTTSGLPVYVEIWDAEFCPGTQDDYRIILTLIES